jgi:hypothetical protein
MKYTTTRCTYLALTTVLVASTLWDATATKVAAASSTFVGEKTAWHGFGIYGENPALRSLMSKNSPLDQLAALAKAGVPLIHVCGSLDPWLNDQTRVVEKRYKELGGPITVIIKEGEGHYPLAPKDPKAVVDLITRTVF